MKPGQVKRFYNLIYDCGLKGDLFLLISVTWNQLCMKNKVHD
jgi:hypothetical protein